MAATILPSPPFLAFALFTFPCRVWLVVAGSRWGVCPCRMPFGPRDSVPGDFKPAANLESLRPRVSERGDFKVGVGRSSCRIWDNVPVDFDPRANRVAVSCVLATASPASLKHSSRSFRGASRCAWPREAATATGDAEGCRSKLDTSCDKCGSIIRVGVQQGDELPIFAVNEFTWCFRSSTCSINFEWSRLASVRQKLNSSYVAYRPASHFIKPCMAQFHDMVTVSRLQLCNPLQFNYIGENDNSDVSRSLTILWLPCPEFLW